MASQLDEFFKIDLASFERDWFASNHEGKIVWSRAGRNTGTIGFRLQQDCMELRYTYGQGTDRKEIRERVDFTFTAPKFGGQRRWFICPECENRCRTLFGGRYFRCRKCRRATYPSQYNQLRLPGLSSIENARKSLNGDTGIFDPFPEKPKGMHWRTYRRLKERDRQALNSIERALEC